MTALTSSEMQTQVGGGRQESSAGPWGEKTQLTSALCSRVRDRKAAACFPPAPTPAQVGVAVRGIAASLRWMGQVLLGELLASISRVRTRICVCFE